MNELSMSMFGSQKDYWKARAERAEGLLRDVAAVFARYGGTLCDCIDNDGQPYPSQALADALAQTQEADKLVWCDCGDGFPVRSYGAGYMAAAGKCENCDAAEADQ